MNSFSSLHKILSQKVDYCRLVFLLWKEKKKPNRTKANPQKKKTKAAPSKYSREKKNLLYYSDINAINYLIR